MRGRKGKTNQQDRSPRLVCKTSIRGFESHPRLQGFRSKSVDYNFQRCIRVKRIDINMGEGLDQELSPTTKEAGTDEKEE